MMLSHFSDVQEKEISKIIIFYGKGTSREVIVSPR